MADTIFKVVKKPIFFVLLLALVLRLWGITYGFPLFLVNDETPLVYGALKMIELKTLIPAFHQEEFKKVLYYAPIPSYFFLLTLSPVIAVHYLWSGAPPLADYKDMLALDPSFLWIAARVLIALIGIADIFFVYAIAKRLWQSERAAIFSVLFLALSFWHLQLSHNVRHWLPAAFFLTFVWYVALRIREGSVGWKWYLSGGLIAGLVTGGVNTAAAVGLIPLALAHFRAVRGGFFSRVFDKKFLALFFVFLSVALLFVALYPYGLTRAEGAAGASDDVWGRFSALSGKSLTDWFGFIAEYIRTLWRFETPLFLVSLLGMFLFLWRKKTEWVWAVLMYAFSFFSLLYFFDDFTARGVIFIVPLLAITAGYAAGSVFEFISGAVSNRSARFMLHALCFILFFGWQLITDLRYDWLLSQKDTRLVTQEWISKNIPAGSRILADSQYMRIQNTKEGIRDLMALDSAGIRASDRIMLETADTDYPRPSFYLLNLNFVSSDIRQTLTRDPAALRARRFQYLVVEYTETGGLPKDVLPLIADAKLIQHISPWKSPRGRAFDGSGKVSELSLRNLFSLSRLGLFVDIYELP